MDSIHAYVIMLTTASAAAAKETSNKDKKFRSEEWKKFKQHLVKLKPAS